MATIHSFAPEILSDILEYAHDPLKPSSTASYSLVCRKWREESQLILCGDINIPVCHGSSGGKGGGVAVLPDCEAEVARWEAYACTRPYAPRRVVLAGCAGGWLTKGSPELGWCAGVKELTLLDVIGYAGLLEDSSLHGESDVHADAFAQLPVYHLRHR
ncbi:hypothetical protein P7C70_g1995, partial [Phenoliferia sp. Uapishka_3]